MVVVAKTGLNKLDDITTLGRGGSDTSAVLRPARRPLPDLHRCGRRFTADLCKVRSTRKLEEITFDEMLELASLGAQVLNNRSVELAKEV